jgi:hypothetical protein
MRTQCFNYWFIYFLNDSGCKLNLSGIDCGTTGNFFGRMNNYFVSSLSKIFRTPNISRFVSSPDRAL